MNCRKGDIAYVIADPTTVNCAGRIVKCLANGPNCGFGPTWEVDPGLPNVYGETIFLCEDSMLRPIENPGDDVHDVRDILIPQHLKETA